MGQRRREQERRDFESLVEKQRSTPYTRPVYSNPVEGKPRPNFHDVGNKAVTHYIYHYPLPDGLAEGVEVEIIAFTSGYCDVKDATGKIWKQVSTLALNLIK